jgi:uncharacterized repeat protein (TIGR01451 family)
MKALPWRQPWVTALGAAFAAGLLLVASASAIGTLDQHNSGLPSSSWGFGGVGSAEQGQTLTAGLTGSLDTAEVALCAVGAPGDLVAKIEGTHKDLVSGELRPVDADVLATQTLSASSVVASVPTCPTDPALSHRTVQISFDSPASIEAGTVYALVLSSPSSSSGNGYEWGRDESNVYSGGSLCYAGTPGVWGCEGDFSDAVFATYVTAIPPQVGMSPSSLSFGDQGVGSTSAPQTVTITNTAASGAQSLAIGQLAIGGANAGDFSLGTDNCSNASVAPGDSCGVEISFAPTVTGSRNATVDVPSNAASSPDHVALSGTGTPQADVALSMTGPASASRGKQISYQITVTNKGPSPAHNVVLTDPLPGGTSFVSANSSKGKCSYKKGTVSCSLGDLSYPGSAGGAISVKITAKAGSTITNIASAYSTADGGPATFDPDTSNNWESLNTTVN